MLVSIVTFALVGCVVALLASMLVRGGTGVGSNLALGIAGGAAGGMFARMMGWTRGPVSATGFAMALVCAASLLVIARVMHARSHHAEPAGPWPRSHHHATE